MIHNSDDDRVAYQETAALQRAGDEVSVFSAYEQKEKSREEKSKWLLQQLVEYQPEVIVCDTPIAVKIAYKAKKKIGKQVRVLYDITEWYPSKKKSEKCTWIEENSSSYSSYVRIFIGRVPCRWIYLWRVL